MLAAARHYAATGWPVFVLGRTKRPVANCPPCHQAGRDHDRQACACLTCHGFYAATLDPDRAAAMLSAVPRGLLAIRTGTAAGLVVIDIDPAHGGRLDPALMTPTAAVASGGGGWHLYYAHPGPPVLSRPLPGRDGIDVKADGGYVVAPPSTHPTSHRPYRWTVRRGVEEMPPALHTAVTRPSAPTAQPSHLATPRPPARPPSARRGGGGGGISHPDLLMAAHLSAVAHAPEGRRRTTLYGAARGVARLVAAGHLDPGDACGALADAGRAADQTDRDIRAAIGGGFRDEGVPL
ncbi:bifunctional DNA primase/polymerase [Pseudofrankia sp. DC12]|uniref:bifunctional DNA primase/polymerase n=1 Tax=Pseudofrankia sp. DC12 TaxID=683315 RepID=UPI0005F81B57|nr:bifunctional DNA primase/polymerase [Pseudofrankia sp. DC12]